MNNENTKMIMIENVYLHLNKKQYYIIYNQKLIKLKSKKFR